MHPYAYSRTAAAGHTLPVIPVSLHTHGLCQSTHTAHSTHSRTSCWTTLRLQPVGRFFQIKERQTTFTQELRGGMVTFLTVSYILAVNSNIVTSTGGGCAVPPVHALLSTLAMRMCLNPHPSPAVPLHASLET